MNAPSNIPHPTSTKPRSDYVRPLDLRNGRVDMSHGSGGRAGAQLVREVFLPAFDNIWLGQGDDGARLPPPPPGELVMATDMHVITPLFFAGGDIGCLSVHGTVNDLAVMGATPLYLAVSFVLEEGFPLADLQRIAQSMGRAARAAGVPIVTGDTKVVEQGKADGVFISSTGVGFIPAGAPRPSGRRAQPGDVVLVSGTMGDHGVTILSTRESLGFETEIQSDTAAVHHLVAELLDRCPNTHVLRDPTRGGLGTTLNEIAQQSGVGMRIDESAIPVRPQVAAACEFLGLDPLYVANEGKLVVVCPPDEAEAALTALRAHPLGRDAARIGEVVADDQHFVEMRTRLGGRRVVDWLSGEQLPRIC
jgi:hydrogenase expression/formation protein HypE